MQDKFPEDQRTFETRLLFINELFSDLHPQEEIMKKCVEHKLQKSFEAYEEDLKRSVNSLEAQDPMKILKRVNF